MKINKIFDGESVQFELTELLPVQYEAIMCGLELLDEKREQEQKKRAAVSGWETGSLLSGERKKTDGNNLLNIIPGR